jgi:hypothetical protein
MKSKSKTHAAAIRIIDALDVAFGGRSNWGPEELALAIVGHIANQGFPQEEWYSAIEVLAHEDAAGLPDGWDVRYSEAYNAERLRRRKRLWDKAFFEL